MKRTRTPDFAEQRKAATDAKKALLEKLKGGRTPDSKEAPTDTKKSS